MRPLFFIFLFLNLFKVSAQTFNPTADTYVRNGTYASKNYGSATSMEVKESTISGNYRLAFLKFDITGITSISSAKLRLYFSGGSSSNVSIHPVSSTWTESKLTWNNKPLESTSIASKSISTNNIYHEWDITSYINSAIASNQYVVSFVVKDIASGSTMSISSRQATTNKPQLVIITNAVPNAPSLLTGSASSTSQIQLNWTDNASNETGYKIEYKSADGSYALAGTVGANVNTFTHSGLAVATTYTYRVYAYNAIGNSTYSNEVSVATNGSTTNAYYIDAINGNDTYLGTSPSTAWKNISKINNMTFAAGTKIYLRSGSTWTGQQLKFKGSGTITSPIIVDKYDLGSKPILHGNGLVGEGVVYLYNQEFIEVNNLEITNSPTGINNSDFFLSVNPNGGDRRGVMVAIDNFGTADHIYLKNLDIHHIKGQLGSGSTAVNGAIPKRTGGIFFTVLGVTETSSSKSRFNDVLINGCNIYYCENIGFALDNEWNVYYPGGQYSTLTADQTEYANWFDRRNTNLIISSNIFHHIGKNALIVRMADETGRIEYNTCYETALGTTGNTMFTARCKGTVFQYNEGYFNRATTQTVNPGSIDGSLYDADYGSVGVIFQYSYSHDNSEGLYWGCNTRGSANNTSGVPDPGDVGCTVRYNISQNDKGDLIFFNYPSAGNEIYNNVFYIASNLSPNIIHESSDQHTYNFRNNIIYNLSTTANYALKLTGQTRNISNNIFYGYHATGDATVAEPADPNKITSDPLFINAGSGTLGISTLNGYKLQNTSPAINSGMVIASNGSKDFWGNALYTGNPDRGCFESSVSLSSFTTNNAVRLSNTELIPEFKMFPNPSISGIINVVPSTMDGRIWSYQIIDQMGRQLLAQKSAPGLVKFDLGKQPAGIYYLQISQNDGRSIKTMRIFHQNTY